MAHKVELSEAVAALQTHFGHQLRAGRDEGRDMMADALEEHFGMSEGEAEELIQVLEQAHTIRWVERGDAQDVAIGAPTTGQGMPLGVPDAYWQF